MGVPKFYSWLRLKNAQHRGILQRDVPALISSLSLDMNGMLHNVASLVFAYGDNASPEREKVLATMTREELYKEYFAALSTAILNVLVAAAPRDMLILAIDGVAPRAKINAQRSRRFSSTPVSPYFNSCLISPGTDFMFLVDEFLKSWIVDNDDALPPSVIYSSHLVPGEAEQKILFHLRNLPEGGTHCINGLDADLVILSLTLPQNIIVMREDINDIVNVTNLKEYLSQRLRTGTAISDFLVLSFLLGNDFLPSSPPLNNLGQAIEVLLDAYTRLGQSLVKDNAIDYDFLRRLLNSLPEKSLLTENLLHSKSNEAEKFFTRKMLVTREGPKSVEELNLEAYRKDWYNFALGPRLALPLAARLLGRQPFPVTEERIRSMQENYLEGLTWNYLYYTGQPVNMAWYYAYHVAPLLSNIGSYTLQRENILPHPEDPLTTTYLNAPQQLTAIIPLSFQKIIPSEMRQLIGTYLFDEFPQEALIEEKQNSPAWHKLVLLPFLSEERLVLSTPAFALEEISKYAPQQDILLKRERRQVFALPPATRTVRGRGNRGESRGRGNRGGRAGRGNWRGKRPLL